MNEVIAPGQQKLPTLEQIKRLQEAMVPIQCELPDPTHFFAHGMYLRELTIPAGMLLVGKIHKHEHFFLVLKGKAEVISEFGRDTVEAGYISVSPPGTKRVILAIEETKLVNVHLNKNDSRCLEEIEEELIETEILKISADVVRKLS